MSFSVEKNEDGRSRLIFYGPIDHKPEIGEEFVFYSGSGRHCFYWDGREWVNAWELLGRSARKIENRKSEDEA
jgi:hypothetical protein